MGFFDIFKRKNKKTEIKTKTSQTFINEINLGILGKFKSNQIDTALIIEDLNHKKIEPNLQSQQAKSIVKNWKELIENNSQYIINYFLSHDIINFGLDENFDNWIFGEDTDLDETEKDKLREQYQTEINEQINTYLNKENPKDIKELYQKYFKHLDYDKFISTIKLEYLHMDSDSFSIQLSDKNFILFCSAYESFDNELDGLDWHNF